MVYGYIRVSTTNQNLARQRSNIEREYPEVIIYEEKYSAKTDIRPVFQRLLRNVKSGDVIVFDEVSRMSRNAEEGFEDYRNLFDKGVELRFIKEPQINSDVYKTALDTSIEMTGNDIADIYIEATNKVLMILAEKQIKAAFEQAEKERILLSKRTREGMAKGRKAGRIKGVPQHQKKEEYAKKIIRKNNVAFGGSLNNIDTMKLAGISAPTFYKYIREMKGDKPDETM